MVEGLTVGRRGRRTGRSTGPGASTAWAAAVVLALGAAPIEAQYELPPVEGRWTDATWVDDMGFAAANAMLSGVMGGISAVLRGEASFAEGFVHGSLGGAVVYGGKRLSVARFAGAGALGRVVTSAGATLIHESGPGGVLRTIVIPFGPLRLYYDRGSGAVRVRPDLVASYWGLYGLFHGSLDLDPRRSASAGAMVFVTTDASLDSANGSMAGGTIFLDRFSRAPMEDVFAHERAHMAQWDQWYLGVARPIEKWAGERLGIGFLLEHVDVPLSPGTFWLPIGNRAGNPWEVEAEYLEIRSGRK